MHCRSFPGNKPKVHVAFLVEDFRDARGTNGLAFRQIGFRGLHFSDPSLNNFRRRISRIFLDRFWVMISDRDILCFVTWQAL